MLHHQDAALDLAFQALSDAGRRAMVERLSQGPASVSELAAPMPMTLSAVVQHLKILEEAGLVTSRKAGRVRTCRLAPDAIGRVERWVTERRAFWERQYDQLDAYLAEPGETDQ